MEDGSWISVLGIILYALYSIFGSAFFGDKKTKVPKKEKRSGKASKPVPSQKKTIEEIMQEYLQEIAGEQEVQTAKPHVEPVVVERREEVVRESIGEAYNVRRDEIIRQKTSDSRMERQAKLDAKTEAEASQAQQENVFTLDQAKSSGIRKKPAMKRNKSKKKKFNFDMNDAILYNVILNKKQW